MIALRVVSRCSSVAGSLAGGKRAGGRAEGRGKRAGGRTEGREKRERREIIKKKGGGKMYLGSRPYDQPSIIHCISLREGWLL